MLRLAALLLMRCRAAPTADEWPLVLAGSGKGALKPHCDPTAASDRPCDAMCVREKACVHGPRPTEPTERTSEPPSEPTPTEPPSSRDDGEALRDDSVSQSKGEL